MTAPVNAELANYQEADLALPLEVRLTVLAVHSGDVARVAATLRNVKALWSASPLPVDAFTRCVAENDWSRADMAADRVQARNLTIYKYFCGPRIYLDPKISDRVEVPYTENDGLVKVVHTAALQAYVAEAGGWDLASTAFIERQRGLELVGMGYGWWLVTSEEQNLN